MLATSVSSIVKSVRPAIQFEHALPFVTKAYERFIYDHIHHAKLHSPPSVTESLTRRYSCKKYIDDIFAV
jgi:hypothetical protein